MFYVIFQKKLELKQQDNLNNLYIGHNDMNISVNVLMLIMVFMECTKNRMFEVWIAFGDKLGHGQT